VGHKMQWNEHGRNRQCVIVMCRVDYNDKRKAAKET
jgi:hypothetical protein